MKTAKILIPDGKQTEWREIDGVTTLVLVDEEVKDNRPAIERIKTFEDACKELQKRAENGDALARRLLEDWDNLTTDSADLIALFKIRIIVAALNEGWVPTFQKDEYRYYPWYYFYTKEEIDAMDAEERGRVVGRAFYNANANGGCVYAHAYNASSHSNASYGARLAFKDRARAEYAGRQFAELYAQFLFDEEVEG